MRTVVQIQLALLLVGIPVGSVLAANPDNGPGCGLGKLAWSDYKHQKNIAPQVMMATTNGTFGSQTFGISFGTSGCTNDGQVMARGQGEHLASLATMMGVPVEHQPAFFSLAQDRYRTLMEREEYSPLAVMKAIQETVVGHPLLAGVADRP
jgi:hypothetical protein